MKKYIRVDLKALEDRLANKIGLLEAKTWVKEFEATSEKRELELEQFRNDISRESVDVDHPVCIVNTKAIEKLDLRVSEEFIDLSRVNPKAIEKLDLWTGRLSSDRPNLSNPPRSDPAEEMRETLRRRKKVYDRVFGEPLKPIKQEVLEDIAWATPFTEQPQVLVEELNTESRMMKVTWVPFTGHVHRINAVPLRIPAGPLTAEKLARAVNESNLPFVGKVVGRASVAKVVG